MKTIVYLNEARQELAEAVRFYDHKRKGLGREFHEAVLHAEKAILRSPQAFELHDGVETRRYVLKRFPFAVIYFEAGETIWIIAIAHHRRDPDYWKSRRISFQ